MPRKIEKKQRGVYEREPGSDIWWIRYHDAEGLEHREKVGRRGDTLKLYKLRKTDVLRGVKMPANMKHRGHRFKVIGQEAIDWYEVYYPNLRARVGRRTGDEGAGRFA